MNAITKGKWIWLSKKEEKDEYGEFVGSFSIVKKKNVRLRIACDGFYNVFVNGKLALFFQCADYPQYKNYDERDISRFCKKGENTLRIVVWYLGETNFSYYGDDAGVCFEVSQEGERICFSNENTLSRQMTEYKNGYCKRITSQLGYSFFYDNTQDVEKRYEKSRETGKNYELHKRTIKHLILGKRPKIGVKYGKKSILVDMGQETAGFIDLDFVSPKKQTVLIAYGEHLDDGCVRRIVGGRDFSFEIEAREGRNCFSNYLRRFAGRYLEIFCEEPLRIKYAGIRPVLYPVKRKKAKFLDKKKQKIYDVCVHTLRCCMHEHYEDCPWREQGLYVFDSRNQMLCGYYAFEGFEYQRANLLLIGKNQRENGMLDICFPTRERLTIPFFTLNYILQVHEYLRHTGDESIKAEVGQTVKKIAELFTRLRDANGLIPTLPYPYWNFYEWSEGSDKAWETARSTASEHKKEYDLILNCAYVYMMKLYNESFGGQIDYSATYEAIKNTFFDREKGVYVLTTADKRYSQLGNAYAILIGLGGKALAHKCLTDENMITATLSMRSVLYDALLSIGGYEDYILQDIEKRYTAMLKKGATSFWETEKGGDDFDKAGSLCHGWSAMPIYYYNVLGLNKAHK
ncbi:MAG: hypothetical protein IJX88_01675 [Clostridia bacterium]|nr:hypothetical protein [Clostridia bacterium]